MSDKDADASDSSLSHDEQKEEISGSDRIERRSLVPEELRDPGWAFEVKA